MGAHIRLGPVDRRDLVLPRLIARPEGVNLEKPCRVEDAASFISAPAESGSCLLPVFRSSTPARDTLQRAVEEDHELLAGGAGLSVLAALHRAPQRELHTPDAVILLGAYAVGDEYMVVTARWTVERYENNFVRAAELVELDDFALPGDLRRLELELRSLAAETDFRPATPDLRALGLITPAAVNPWAESTRQLVAAAAVQGAELTVLPPGDPRDTAYIRRVRELVASNRHSLLVTLSVPNERWVNKQGAEFAARGRAWKRLNYSSLEEALDELAGAVRAVADSGPVEPTLRWGPDALARIEQFVGEAFDLTDRARRHLLSNDYPHPERMLQQLEVLAQLAQAWHDGGESLETRFEEWARSAHGLKVAMRDKRIPYKKSWFHYKGQRLFNQPHVKVDDYTNPSECGRIYFALYGAERRIVVDYIGLHGRA